MAIFLDLNSGSTKFKTVSMTKTFFRISKISKPPGAWLGSFKPKVRKLNLLYYFIFLFI